MRGSTVTVRIARWSATHPWRAIGAWVVFVLACLVAGNLAGTRVLDDQTGPGESGRAQQIVDSGHFDSPIIENVLITAPGGSLDRAEASAAAGEVRAAMAGLPEVLDVGAVVPAPDGSALLVPVTIRGPLLTAADRVAPVLEATESVQRTHPGLRIEEVGAASLNKALNDATGQDFRTAELFSIPITLLILLLAFGALIAAAVPLLLAISAVTSAIGLAAIASHLVPATSALDSMILLIGMAVGVDYSLFYLRREREERAKGLAHVDAIEIAAATSGRAVAVSGLAVLVAMGGMLVARDAIFNSLAAGAMLVVAVAVLGSLTVLPAVLAKLGRWVDRPRVPLLWRVTGVGRPGAGAGSRFWSVVLRPALRRPAVTLLLSVAALLALAAPALGMRLKLSDVSDLPRSIPILRSYDRLVAAFPSNGSSVEVALRVPAGQAPAARAAMERLGQRAVTELALPAEGNRELRGSADGRVWLLRLGVPHPATSPESVDALKRLRTDVVPATLGALPGADYAVGGWIAGNYDFQQSMAASLPWVIGFVLGLTFLVLLVTFRSVVVALTAIALNMLSVAAAYGFLTWVFQGHWAEGLLGFRSNGAVVTWLPLFLFVVLFGLSMDYHVFVVSRIREAVDQGMPNRHAVAHGIVTSAGVVTSAAAVMIAVFSIFGTLSSLEMKQMGVGLAVAILLDATIIRAVVLPSAMILLGRWNWWAPGFLRPAVRGGEPAVEELAPVR